jgi:hypothetical protein
MDPCRATETKGRDSTALLHRLRKLPQNFKMQHITDYRDMARVISWINIDLCDGPGHVRDGQQLLTAKLRTHSPKPAPSALWITLPK